MPIYEYRCSSCSHEFETLQKFSDPLLKACPACGTDTLVKKISAAGFQLKGTGWYATDFKGGSKPAASKPSDEQSGGKTGEKSDAKSGEKSDAKSGDKSDGKSESKSDKAESASTKSESKSEAAPAASGSGSGASGGTGS